MGTPLVSWLLCAHKLHEYLFQAIDSCLSQTMKDFELVIVLNGDQRNVIFERICEKYKTDKRVRLFTTEIRYLTFSLNLGLHHARAEYVARMDADDISTPDRLEKQVNFMEKNSYISVLGTSYNIIDEQGMIVKSVRPPLSNDRIKKQLKYRNPICHPSVMYKRRVIVNAGGYMGGIYAEDYDLWLRLATHKDIIFANLDHICLNYRSFGIGEARNNLISYSSVAATMMCELLSKRRVDMVPGLLYTVAKSFLLARRY